MELRGRKALVGMIHLGALPGTPRQRDPVHDVVRRAVTEARLLADCGFDALLLENMHDVPYLRRDVGPEIIAAMTACACAVHDVVDIPIGIQVLAGANHGALAIAHASGASFIRTEGYVFASVADEGLMDEADAGPLLRYRRQIGADGIQIFCDLKKKHSSHAITADVDMARTAEAAAFFGADAVIVTGDVTGDLPSPEDVTAVRSAIDLPVILGSGVTPDNAASGLEHADALIVGSWFKEDGQWHRPPDPERAHVLVQAVANAR